MLEEIHKAEICRINLHRTWWLIIVTTSVTLLLGAINLVVRDTQLSSALAMDAIGSLSFLTMAFLAMRGSLGHSFQRLLPYYYTAFFLGLNILYFFASIPGFGFPTVYLYGSLAPAVVLLIPPRLFQGMVILSYSLFFALLFLGTAIPSKPMIGIVLETIAVAGVACLANWFLYTGTVRQIVQRHQLAQQNAELERLNTKLHQRNSEIAELMAFTTHDLRSPLSSMHTLCEMTAEEPEWQSEPYSSLLSAFRRSSETMLNRVSALVEAHRVDQETAEIECVPLELTPILKSVVARHQQRATTKEIALEFLPASAPIRVIAAHEPLERILDNLLSNALKFSPPGTRVVVDLAPSDPKTVVVQVRDEGPGIPEEARCRLFRKFQRPINHPTAGEDRSGLGLFIAKTLAEEIGGSIEFQPNEPRGSNFRLHLLSALE